MDPSLTLLNTKIPPFRFRHQMSFRDQLGYVLGQHDMPVIETWEGEKFVSVLGTIYQMRGPAGKVKTDKPVCNGREFIKSYCSAKAARNKAQVMGQVT